MHNAIRALFPDALCGNAVTLRQLLPLPELLPRHLPELLAAAGTMACTCAGPTFRCGIINAKSGDCREDCCFCAQSRRHGGNAPVYPLLSREAMLRQAESFAAAGVRFMGIVTSGACPAPGDFEQICETGSHIRARIDIRLCASLGLLRPKQADALRQAGFARYHHNLETAQSYYPSICTTHRYERRIQTVKHAKLAGLRVCSGGIFGVGENWAQRFELASLLQTLDVDSIPVNFLMPVPGTPLEKYPPMPAWEGLAVIALLRLMHPARDIICCGGRTQVLQQCEALLFSAGANGLMTGNYLTAEGNPFQRDKALLNAFGIQEPTP
ncbi:MAG: biotin synthase BioB [Deltaproteobacteria bacterium]|nr:biotin synthase BioB [Deltaproteobacteria bacterium]